MSRDFNPHEILNNLRAQQGRQQHGSSTISSVNPTYINGNTGSKFTNSSLSTLISRAKMSSGEKKHVTTIEDELQQLSNKVDEERKLRLKLEKEIIGLTQNIKNLKYENLTLRNEIATNNTEHERFKKKVEKTIAKLRAKLAIERTSLSGSPHPFEGDKSLSGLLYSPSNGTKTKNVSSAELPSASAPKHHVHRTSTVSGSKSKSFNNVTIPEGGDEQFREPTFSELMRRSTADRATFEESLRRQSVSNEFQKKPAFKPKVKDNYTEENVLTYSDLSTSVHDTTDVERQLLQQAHSKQRYQDVRRADSITESITHTPFANTVNESEIDMDTQLEVVEIDFT